MTMQSTLSGERPVTVAGLMVGAAGIAVLWASGVEVPVAIPPGLVIDRDTLSTIIGTWIQIIGVLTALIAGVIVTRNNYRKPAQARQ